MSEREERLRALSRVLERLEDRNEEENAADAMPSVAEAGTTRQARSTSPQPPASTGRTTTPFGQRPRYPFEPVEPPFAPQGVTRFLNTQFDRVLR